MGDHDDELLAWRAAGALDAEEEARLSGHLEACEPCREGARAWDRLVTRVERLSDVVPSPGLLSRTRAAVERWQVEGEERAWTRAALGFLIIFGWTLTGVAWLLVEILAGELAVRLDRPVGSTAAWFGVYLVAGWAMAAAAAVLLGRRAPEEGRIA